MRTAAFLRAAAVSTSLLMVLGCSGGGKDAKSSLNMMGFAEFTYGGKTVHTDKVELRIMKSTLGNLTGIAWQNTITGTIGNERDYGADGISIGFQVPYNTAVILKDLEGKQYETKVYIYADFGDTHLISNDKNCKVKFLKIDTDKLRAYGTFSFSAYPVRGGFREDGYEEGDEEAYFDEQQPEEVTVTDGIFFAEITDTDTIGLPLEAGEKK